jgi:hypothetical protein
VHAEVANLYKEFMVDLIPYVKFIQDVDAFLAGVSAKADQSKKVPLDVNEKSDKKKVNWEVTYKYPRSITVNESHTQILRELAKQDIGK